MGAISIGVAFYMFAWVKRQDAGSEKAREIAGYIKEASGQFLRKLYVTLAVVAVVIGVILVFTVGIDLVALAEGHFRLDPEKAVAIPLAFVFGSLCAALAGYMGMSVAVEANVRTAVGCAKGLVPGFRVAFYGGSVMGLATTGIAVVGMTIIYLITRNPGTVLGFSVGASALALLAKAGGGIYTKIADVSADLVGKVEAGIPEDDPRNPAVIADNVGDNVGDIAGMGADIYDSYVAAVVAAMLLGSSILTAAQLSPELATFLADSGLGGARPVIFPLIMAGAGILASLIGIQLAKVKEGGRPGAALNRGTVLTTVIFAVFITIIVLATGMHAALLIPAIAGLVVGVLIGFTTDYFTSDAYSPVKHVAEMAQTGSAINIIGGFSYGLMSIIPSILGIVIATLVSYYSLEAFGLNGLYGVGIAAVGMLSITGMIVTSDAYGPISDNAKGIAEMADMPEETIDTADVLDSAGNTAAAVAKGFAIGAAALTVLALFSAFGEEVRAYWLEVGVTKELGISLRDPMVIAGVFLGAMAPPIFSALTMLSVTKNAFKMIEEIRRQWRERPGILEGTEAPDYNTCVGLASADALKALVFPAAIAVLLPLAVGFILGPNALGGFLGGAIFTGVIFALFMANSGGTWDNAKKYIEAGEFGGKGSDAHKAAVVGDTVGDPFKDTAGPSLNTLIAVMALFSSLFAPLIAAVSIFG
jgi:K(+)-stimulated pyrophosphate-energized sodium pump